MSNEIREFPPDDHAAVVELWRATPGIVVRDADAFAPLTAYLAKNPGLSFVAVDEFWRHLGWQARTEIRLMSHTQSGVTTTRRTLKFVTRLLNGTHCESARHHEHTMGDGYE